MHLIVLYDIFYKFIYTIKYSVIALLFLFNIKMVIWQI